MEKQRGPRVAYEKFDDAVMAGATKAVRMWNWTTGCTKASLACSMNWVGSAAFMFEGTRISYETGDSALLCMGFAVPICAHVLNKVYIKKEKLEAEAAKTGNKNLEVEEFKDTCKWTGMGFGLLTIGVGVSSIIDPALVPIASADAVIGFARYIMRTEYMPPRKNAFARGWEKLKEYARDMQQPVLNSVPVSSFIGHELRK